MSVRGKLETDVEIKAPAHKFHELISCRPHHVPNISSDKVHGCDLHAGDWGKEGTIVRWTYTHDGKVKTAKEIIETIDAEKNLITFKVLEGELMEEYKAFIITFQVSPKHGGSLVHVIVEYEKLHKNIGHPETLVEFLAQVVKDMGDHLTQA